MAHGQTKDFGLIQGRVARVTRLDGCGRPLYGDGNSVVSEGFIQVQYTANTTDTDAVTVTNAGGKTILNQPGFSTPAGYALQMDFGKVDPEFVSIMTGQEVFLDIDGNAVGFGVDTKVDVSTKGFALEVWAGAPGGDACEDESAEGSYGYILVPFVTGGVLGDFTVQNDAVTFTVQNANTKDGNGWGKGPYDVVMNAGGGPGARVPGPLLESLPSTQHLVVLLVTVAPPEPLAGARPLLRRSDTPLTSITGTTTAGSLEVDFSGTPDPTDGVGIWWDFGDGTWDYVVEGGGDTTHTYDEAGTYKVRATTNGVWVETSVTVPGA